MPVLMIVLIRAAAALLASVMLAPWVPAAQAQQGQTITITVASVTRAQAASRAALPIEVSPQHTVAKNSFIRIRGLPPAAALSDGHAIAPGAWAVPLNALVSLNIILPVGAQGQSDVSISLVSVEGAVLAEAKTSLIVTAAPASATETKAPSPPMPAAPRVLAAPPPPVPPPPLAPAERERALGLHTLGQEQLERGNVYAARKFFERATEAGLAQSAVALAATYDPDELARLKVVGLKPDPEAARKWYERARELGAVEAVERLRRLGAR